MSSVSALIFVDIESSLDWLSSYPIGAGDGDRDEERLVLSKLSNNW